MSTITSMKKEKRRTTPDEEPVVKRQRSSKSKTSPRGSSNAGKRGPQTLEEVKAYKWNAVDGDRKTVYKPDTREERVS